MASTDKRIFFATDYDGTLCHHPPGVVVDREIEAVRRWREEGNIFGIITGRDYDSIHDTVAEQPGLSVDFIACMTGAMIHDAEGNLISERRADGKCLRALVEFIRDTGGVYACFDIAKQFYSVKTGELEISCQVPIEFTDTVEFFHCAYTRYPDVDTASTAADEMRRLFGKFVNPHQNGVNVDIPPMGCSKATAVRDAAALFGIDDLSRMYTSGDNFNDIPMFSPWRGIAMANGCDELKRIAFATAENIAAALDVARNGA